METPQSQHRANAEPLRSHLESTAESLMNWVGATMELLQSHCRAATRQRCSSRRVIVETLRSHHGAVEDSPQSRSEATEEQS